MLSKVLQYLDHSRPQTVQSENLLPNTVILIHFYNSISLLYYHKSVTRCFTVYSCCKIKSLVTVNLVNHRNKTYIVTECSQGFNADVLNIWKEGCIILTFILLEKEQCLRGDSRPFFFLFKGALPFLYNLSLSIVVKVLITSFSTCLLRFGGCTMWQVLTIQEAITLLVQNESTTS